MTTKSKTYEQDEIIECLKRQIQEIENSRYGEQERKTPGTLATLYQAIEERKASINKSTPPGNP
jgi:hypothetical protein